MNPACVSLLCDPLTRGALAQEGEFLVDRVSGHRYSIRNGIPSFLCAGEVIGQNRKYQKMYDRLAPVYDIATGIYHKLVRKTDTRLEYMSRLKAPASGRVLEVSVGTGANLPYLPATCEVYGLDLSWGMLQRCRRNLRTRGATAELFQGEAERLPFRDAVFDCVFHVGGINFFNDKTAALAEMIRVARPGTSMIVVDETEKLVRGAYSNNPLTRKEFQGQGSQAYAPVQHLPAGMEDIEVQEIANGELYCLMFRRPAAVSTAKP